MRHEKPFLEPELTLSDLSERCGIPVHYLSQILNENLNRNFYNFINSYRIEEAKRMLSDPEERNLTILEVLYTVGFNSKSVFNTAFKRFAGMTPTDFKKKHRIKPLAA